MTHSIHRSYRYMQAKGGILNNNAKEEANPMTVRRKRGFDQMWTLLLMTQLIPQERVLLE